MDVNKNFILAEFIDNIKIHPKYIGKDIEKNILRALKQSKEGICSNHGYIKRNSIKIIKISSGKVEMSTFHGYMNFMVKYSAMVCNPVKGNIVNAIVVNMNNFGILCSSFITEDNGSNTPILEIIIPKHSLTIQSDVDLKNNVQINNEVKVQIVGKKYQLYNKKISIIGKIVKSNNVNVKLDDNIDLSQSIDDDEDDLELDISDDEEEDEKNEDEEEGDEEDKNNEEDDFDEDVENSDIEISDNDVETSDEED
jgi:DNA-directed RNA polymerase subunit E'/Rpb7